MTVPTLYRRFAGHARLQGGSMFWYSVLDAGKNKIGSLTMTTIRKRGKVTKTLAFQLLDGQEFDDVDDFKREYVRQLRDAEWDAAAPKGQSDAG